jgi:DNA replication licensing factor MCM3
VRTLETMIRLATAHSKLRLSKQVTTKDIDIAVNMVHLSIFGETFEKEDEEEEDDHKDLAMEPTDKKASKADKSRMEVDAKKKVKFDKDMDDEEDFRGDNSAPANSRRLTRR